LSCDQQAYNAVHGALRALGERANSLLKITFKALRRWRGCPWRIGIIVAAALVLLHHEHNRNHGLKSGSRVAPGQSARPLPPPQDQTDRGHRHLP